MRWRTFWRAGATWLAVLAVWSHGNGWAFVVPAAGAAALFWMAQPWQSRPAGLHRFRGAKGTVSVWGPLTPEVEQSIRSTFDDHEIEP